MKKIINLRKVLKEKKIRNQDVNLSLDDSFVHHFIEKGGKFLYCTNLDEVTINLKKIIHENNYTDLTVTDRNLYKLIQKQEIIHHQKLTPSTPFFTTCEYLIADKGSILFTSNQLNSTKLSALTENLIVYSTTSQLVKNMREALSGIQSNYRGNIPTNISAVKNYETIKNDDNYLNYGNGSSKNLYLLLFEDL